MTSIYHFLEFLRTEAGHKVTCLTGQYRGTLINSFETIQISSKSVIKHSNDIENYIRIIYKGYGAVYANNKLKRIYHPGEVIQDLASFKKQERSSLTIESRTKMTYGQMTYDQYQALTSTESIYLGFFSELHQYMRRIDRSWIEVLSVEEKNRYKFFLYQYPNLIQLLSVQEIADLLHIKYGSLKRYRQQLSATPSLPPHTPKLYSTLCF
ncbi:hypothetical protein KI659_16965 [Litoribacter alkaliphilus]|uniref:Crp/Fnr family transcriptional regulator n=1 Tax=Litoribacter ruber TaxID=702568 RepID=A0AAP2G6H6_9BACT|nr:hypothetical protein [Litoribacter alkaliphilus]MBS9525713.1 hypothetical protein [Litoribacter alkaliphilus]